MILLNSLQCRASLHISLRLYAWHPCIHQHGKHSLYAFLARILEQHKRLYIFLNMLFFHSLEGKSADYLVTGTWSDKAAIEVRIFGILD